MAQTTCNCSRLHNFSDEALADAIGNGDLALKAHEAEVRALKEEFKHRGLLTAAGEHFTVTRSDQISSRLDVAAVKQFFWATRGVVSKRRASPPSSASRPSRGSPPPRSDHRDL